VFLGFGHRRDHDDVSPGVGLRNFSFYV